MFNIKFLKSLFCPPYHCCLKKCKKTPGEGVLNRAEQQDDHACHQGGDTKDVIQQNQSQTNLENTTRHSMYYALNIFFADARH